MNITVDARFATELQAFSRVHVAIDGAIHDDVGNFDVAFNEAAEPDASRRAIGDYLPQVPFIATPQRR